jgi:hypothetical protein
VASDCATRRAPARCCRSARPETQTIAVIARNGSIQRLTRYAAADIASSLRAARGHLAHELGETNQAALAHSGSFLVGNRYRRVLIVEVLGPHGVLLGRVVQPYRRRRFRVVVLRKVRRFAVLGPPIIDHLVVDAQSRELQNGLAEVESRIYWGVYDHPHGLRLFKRPMRSRSRRR